MWLESAEAVCARFVEEHDPVLWPLEALWNRQNNLPRAMPCAPRSHGYSPKTSVIHLLDCLRLTTHSTTLSTAQGTIEQ